MIARLSDLLRLSLESTGCRKCRCARNFEFLRSVSGIERTAL